MAKNKRFENGEKWKAVLSVLTGTQSAVEVAQQLGCYPSMITGWKQEVEAHGSAIFERTDEGEQKNKKIAKLERLIGALTLENGF